MATINKSKAGYRARVRVKGFPCASATFPTRALAERWAKKTEIEMSEARYFGDSYKMTLSELIDKYMAREAPLRLKASTLSTVASTMRVFSGVLGDRLLSHVRPRDILDARDSMIEDYAPATLNRMISNLSSVFAYAVEREHCQVNPCEALKPLKKTERRERVLSIAEENALLCALLESDRATMETVRFALATGARKSEILKLERSDISFSVRAVTFRDTKNGKDRTVPISQAWVDQLENMPGKFTFNYTNWLRALDKACIDDLHFHDLRHTFITRAIAAGHNPLHVAAMVGHSSVNMVQYYTHLGADDLRNLV
jgi:integrase